MPFLFVCIEITMCVFMFLDDPRCGCTTFRYNLGFSNLWRFTMDEGLGQRFTRDMTPLSFLPTPLLCDGCVDQQMKLKGHSGA